MSVFSGIKLKESNGASRIHLLLYPYLYVFLIIVAELVTGYYLYWGVSIHFAVLVALLVHSTFVSDKSLADLLTAMAIAPIIRMLSLTTPLGHFSQISWFVIISIPVFIAAFTVAHLQGISTKQMFLSRPKRQHLPLELGVIILAFPIGLLEYQVLEPNPMVEFTLVTLLAPALIFIVATGVLEEMIFRGLMQSNAERVAGFQGVICVSILFGAMHVTNLAIWDVFVAGGVGFLFALTVRKTGSIWGVSIAHGMVNITLFLIAPHWFGS